MSLTATPVLLIVFNRPNKVRALISALEKIRPTNIYVAADGPRSHRPDDAENCRVVRELVTNLPWPCTVTHNFQEKNLGCRLGVSTGISWFFNQVEEGIILEDDCIPSAEFFTFTTTLLEKHRHDSIVMHIAGTTFLTKDAQSRSTDSYWYSNIALVWGWATWRRAWQQYDLPMTNLDDKDTKTLVKAAFKNNVFSRFWLDLFAHIRDKKVDTWDIQWVYSIIKNNGLCIIPAVNLIENIGFDNEATHTTDSVTHALSRATLEETITHPVSKSVDLKAESALMFRAFLKSWRVRLKYRLLGLLQL